LFLFAAPLLAAPNERQVTQLADGVYAIEHPFGNSGNTTVIIGDRQVFVVDSPNYPAFAREDIAQIRQWTYMRWMHLDFSGGEAQPQLFPDMGRSCTSPAAWNCTTFAKGAKGWAILGFPFLRTCV